MSDDIVPAETIATRILLLRRQKVMLDRDLAALYGVSTKALNQAVKRNAERFPEDFTFQQTSEEADEVLRSQFVTLKRGEHRKYRPYAFTEQGVAMLSSVLRSERAVKVNIAIMRAFVKLRDAIIDAIRQLMAPAQKPRREIDFHVRETAPRYRTRRSR